MGHKTKIDDIIYEQPLLPSDVVVYGEIHGVISNISHITLLSHVFHLASQITNHHAELFLKIFFIDLFLSHLRIKHIAYLNITLEE